MSLSRPTASLLLEGGGPALAGGAMDAAQAAVRRSVLELSVDEAHDRAEISLWRGSPLAGAAPGSVLTIGLGDVGSVQDVATVEVYSVDVTGWGTVVTGYAPSRRLSTTWVGRSYVDRTVGDVVSDLLGDGEVAKGEVDASLTLPVLHVEPRRSVWQHLHALARRCGCQVTSDVDGSVSFTPIPGAVTGGGVLGGGVLGGGVLGGIVSTAAGAAAGLVGAGVGPELREGSELLTFRVGTRSEERTVPLVTAVGSRGGLLVADPDSGGTTTVQLDPLLRTQEAADTATSARRAAARRRGRSATAAVPGRPTLRAGSPVTLRGENFRIVRVRHVLDAEHGYLCDLVLEGAR